MTRTRILSTLPAALSLMACVTINIYFPAAAAEKAADRIIQDVYGQQPGSPAAPAEQPPAPKTPGPSSRHTRPSMVAIAFDRVLNFLVAPAHAAADIDISSPAIQAITRSMAARQPRLDPHYASGAIGMTNDGRITVRDPGVVPLTDRNAVKQLVADDNRDRDALYREIAKANQHPEWEAEIRATFARRWVANAPSGWWYQDGGGSWKRK